MIDLVAIANNPKAQGQKKHCQNEKYLAKIITVKLMCYAKMAKFQRLNNIFTFSLEFFIIVPLTN